MSSLSISFASLAWLMVALVLFLHLVILVLLLVYYAVRLPYRGCNRQWDCNTQPCYFWPYLHFTGEHFGSQLSLTLEVGWLNKWAAFAWNFDEEPWEDEDEFSLPAKEVKVNFRVNKEGES